MNPALPQQQLEPPKPRSPRKKPKNTGLVRSRHKHDILLGRGKGCTSSVGNQRYLALVAQYAAAYTRSKTRKEQANVKMAIIQDVRAAGGYFLQPVPGSNETQWEEAPLETILNKIAQSLRYHIRKEKSENGLDEGGETSQRNDPPQAAATPVLPQTPTKPATVHPFHPGSNFWFSQQQLPRQGLTAQLSQPQQFFVSQAPTPVQLPAIVTPSVSQHQVSDDLSGLFHSDFLRKVSYFGQVQDDSTTGNTMNHLREEV